MLPLKKRILLDENQAPIAVQIDYRDWLEIERTLAELMPQVEGRPDLSSLKGSLRLGEDPIAFQHRIRGEW